MNDLHINKVFFACITNIQMKSSQKELSYTTSLFLSHLLSLLYRILSKLYTEYCPAHPPINFKSMYNYCLQFSKNARMHVSGINGHEFYNKIS